eukprot:11224137-Lingulodinium_polyedra.AAC.1
MAHWRRANGPRLARSWRVDGALMAFACRIVSTRVAPRANNMLLARKERLRSALVARRLQSSSASITH